MDKIRYTYKSGETPSDIEAVGMKMVAKLLKQQNKVEGRGYFKFNKK